MRSARRRCCTACSAARSSGTCCRPPSRRGRARLVVVGHGADEVTAHIGEIAPKAQTVLQAEQRGTGHAVRIALDAVPDVTGTWSWWSRGHAAAARRDAAGAARRPRAGRRRDRADRGGGRSDRPRPHRAGRGGRLAGIVEQRDATPEQLAITRDQRGHVRVRRGRAAGRARQAVPPRTTRARNTSPTCSGLLVSTAAGRSRPFVVGDAGRGLGVNDRAQLAALAPSARPGQHRPDAVRRDNDRSRRRPGSTSPSASATRRHHRTEHTAARCDVGRRRRGGRPGHDADECRHVGEGAGSSVRMGPIRIGAGANVGPFASAARHRFRRGRGDARRCTLLWVCAPSGAASPTDGRPHRRLLPSHAKRNQAARTSGVSCA